LCLCVLRAAERRSKEKREREVREIFHGHNLLIIKDLGSFALYDYREQR
jgi:hypothetical protein